MAGIASPAELRIPVEIRGSNSIERVDALLDTGASSNFIRRTLFSGIEVDRIGPSMIRRKRTITLANGELVNVDPVSFPGMKLFGATLSEPAFFVMTGLTHDAVIGYRTMRDLDIVLRPKLDRAWRFHR